MKAVTATTGIIAGLLLAGQVLCEEAPPPPIRQQIKKSSHERWGYVVMSAGKRHDGLISTTPGKPVRIFDRKKSAYRDIKWKKIESIGQAVDEEWFEREWRWLEGGNDIKVYTDRYYRAAKLRTIILLKSGETITGDAVVPIYVKTGKKRRLLELHKRLKNPKPAAKKDLEPLVYIKKLVLTDKPPDPPKTKPEKK